MASPPLLIKEKPQEPTYTKHDQLHKELIKTFFEEFLEAFFPDIHKELDFRKIKPLSEEVYTNMLDGNARRLDLVIETTLKKTDVVIIVHIEPQSYRQPDFNERMYHYFSMLYNKYRKPIIPIAVFNYLDDWEESQYTMAFDFFQVLTFHYMTLHLRKMNWRDYIRSDNPVAAALLSQMGYKETERIEVKKEFLRMITRLELNPAKQKLLYGFFESYLKLTDEEEEQLMSEVNHLPEANKILELTVSYEERGKEKGKKIGTKIGKKIGKKEVAIEMLKENIDIKLISKVTHLEIEEIKNLEQQL